MSEQSVVEIKNVSYRYDKDNVLENISLTVKQGDFVGLVGPNGSGKSTLIKLLFDLLPMQQGEIYLFGEQINNFRQWERLGFVSQKANSFNSGFPATVFEVVASGLTKKLGLFKRINNEQRERVIDAIKAVGMERFLERNIGELSGGQQQRVFIARALVSDPELLVLDEPTVGVDVDNVRSFYELIKKLNDERNLTIIVVTHDLDSVIDLLNEIIFLNKTIVFDGEAEQFKSTNLSCCSNVHTSKFNTLAGFSND